MGRQQQTDPQRLQAERGSGSPAAPLLLRWMRSSAEQELPRDSPATSVWGRSQARSLERNSHGFYIQVAQIVLFGYLSFKMYSWATLKCKGHSYASIKIAIFKTLRRLDTTWEQVGGPTLLSFLLGHTRGLRSFVCHDAARQRCYC